VLGPENAALIGHYACGAGLFGKAAKLRKVLKASGIPGSEAICIGDEIRDHEAAARVGIAFGAVAWGYARPDALRACSPALTFETMDEIARKLAPQAAELPAGP
jgi:phosphoglycolate phosphatase